VTPAADGEKPPEGRQAFRSPAAVVIWWLWVLFALANLVDLAVQGRDHVSLVAAFILLFVTGVMYVTAYRPRLVADADGLTIANPVRDHRIGWTAVAGAEPTDLLRVRCEWPDGDGLARRVFYSWAVHSSRRRQVAAEMRARRPSRPGHRGAAGAFGGIGGSGGAGGFGFAAEPPAEGDALRLDAARVVATITARAEQARLDAPGAPAAAPSSAWDWTAVAAVLIPGLALLIVALT
jgi:hypothetical protein